MADTLIFFHTPNTRSGGTAVLLEELRAPHEVRLLNQKTGEQRGPDYLAVNPMGKVPAILHGEALVAEQPAVFLYLADLFPEAGLAPPIGDPLRGPYLRWLVFYGSCFEPALVDRATKRDPAPPGMSPYGDFDTMLGTVTAQLRRGPNLLGERFSAADILWGIGLDWGMKFGIVPTEPAIVAYAERITSRPSVAAVTARDAELAAEQAKAAGQPAAG